MVKASQYIQLFFNQLFYQSTTINMKFAIVLLAFAACALAGPVPAALLKHVEVHDENSYTLEYEVDDGTLVKERGVKVEGPEGDVWHRSGLFRFTSPEGQVYEVHYTSDENGYRAEGNHLPKAPAPQH